MMHLKTPSNTARKVLKQVHGMGLMLALTTAKAQVKLFSGLIFILSLAKGAMLKILSAAYEIQFRGKATIERLKEKQLEIASQTGPVTHPHLGSSGQVLQAGTGLSIGYTAMPRNMISFNNNESKPVLVITNDGDVEWHGKPSEAADCLVRTFQFTVEDMKGVTKAARRRYYRLACQNILNKAENMEHDKFVAFLQKQVYNKERRIIMDSLKGEE